LVYPMSLVLVFFVTQLLVCPIYISSVNLSSCKYQVSMGLNMPIYPSINSRPLHNTL